MPIMVRETLLAHRACMVIPQPNLKAAYAKQMSTFGQGTYIKCTLTDNAKPISTQLIIPRLEFLKITATGLISGDFGL